MLYICILSNKFDLKQTIRVLHRRLLDAENKKLTMQKIDSNKLECSDNTKIDSNKLECSDNTKIDSNKLECLTLEDTCILV